jgi:hypothetical protein
MVGILGVLTLIWVIMMGMKERSNISIIVAYCYLV